MLYKEIELKGKSEKLFGYIKMKLNQVLILFFLFIREKKLLRNEVGNFSVWLRKSGWRLFNTTDKLLGLFLSGFILIYKYGFSAIFPQSCRFAPSCSSYGLEALKKHGAIKGLRLTIKRVLRCHPRQPGGFDPVP